MSTITVGFYQFNKTSQNRSGLCLFSFSDFPHLYLMFFTVFPSPAPSSPQKAGGVSSALSTAFFFFFFLTFPGILVVHFGKHPVYLQPPVLILSSGNSLFPASCLQLFSSLYTPLVNTLFTYVNFTWNFVWPCSAIMALQNRYIVNCCILVGLYSGSRQDNYIFISIFIICKCRKILFCL